MGLRLKTTSNSLKFNFPFSWWATRSKIAKEWSKEIESQSNSTNSIIPHLAEIIDQENRRECVYFIRCGDFVKIGKSRVKGINNRINDMQTGNPFLLVLIGLIPVNQGLRAESHIHSMFKPFHHKGEWFHYEGELKNFIDNHELHKKILDKYI